MGTTDLMKPGDALGTDLVYMGRAVVTLAETKTEYTTSQREYNLNELAEALGKTRQTIRNWVRDNKAHPLPKGTDIDGDLALNRHEVIFGADEYERLKKKILNNGTGPGRRKKIN